MDKLFLKSKKLFPNINFSNKLNIKIQNLTSSNQSPNHIYQDQIQKAIKVISSQASTHSTSIHEAKRVIAAFILPKFIKQEHNPNQYSSPSTPRSKPIISNKSQSTGQPPCTQATKPNTIV